MEKLTTRIGLLLLALGLAVAPAACGSDSKDNDGDPPDLTGGDGDTTGGDGDTTGGDGDTTGGDGDGKDCFDDPKTNLEFLNQCLPAGSKVESRKFDNSKRIPNWNGTLPPIN